MNQKIYYGITGVVFLIIAVLHLLRIWRSWEAVIGSWPVPTWLSWVAIVVAGYLAYEGLRACFKNRK